MKGFLLTVVRPPFHISPFPGLVVSRGVYLWFLCFFAFLAF
jgi:hypothetical protein